MKVPWSSHICGGPHRPDNSCCPDSETLTWASHFHFITRCPWGGWGWNWLFFQLFLLPGLSLQTSGTKCWKYTNTALREMETPGCVFRFSKMSPLKGFFSSESSLGIRALSSQSVTAQAEAAAWTVGVYGVSVLPTDAPLQTSKPVWSRYPLCEV